MDISYVPENPAPGECDFLRKNFISCLYEKGLKDEVKEMNCNIEYILWFNLECPNQFAKFTNKKYLREIYQKLQTGQQTEPDYVKL